VRVFVDEGQIMQMLLAKMKTQDGRVKDYLIHLLAAFPQQLAEVQLQPSSLIPQPLVDPLSERELDVLRLLAEGLSNAEIARRLVVSVGTVKACVASITVGVQSRTQAIVRATELNLL
jgi:LuxR family maltose regulon positive regulatory protein